jgi:3'-phosphoadenosine 5'-phosphosulfate sulfotransferase (PAPS reductase)/FAD synthetase
MTDLRNVEQVLELRDRGALFVLNHSGGKDSQAMTIRLREIVPHAQLLVIHADLPGVDWDCTWLHVDYTCRDLNRLQVRANKTFVEMVRRRKITLEQAGRAALLDGNAELAKKKLEASPWPSSGTRQCTSDLKRGPVEKAIRRWILAHKLSGLVVNCQGIRAEESAARAKKRPFELSARNSKAGREWYDWLPIFDMKLPEVWETIAAAGQKPHYAYGLGMTRLSCMFCILASKADLQTSARVNPEAFKEICDLEKELGSTMKAVKVKGKTKSQPIALSEFIK